MAAGGQDKDGKLSASLDEQIAQTFRNIELALKHAGAGDDALSKVISVRSYHVDLNDETAEQMARHMRRVFPNHRPVLTMLGVARLRMEGMKVEIEGVAWIS